jgi:hypothetical protein
MIRRPVATLVLAGAALLAAYVAAMIVLAKPDGRVVFGDATHHFVQLRSLVYDRDLHFQNEYVRIYRLRGEEPGTEWIFSNLTVTGRVRNYMPIGPALLWAPLYLLLSALQLVASWGGLARPPDGFDRVLQMVPGITGIAAATVAAIVTWRTVRKTTGDASAIVGVFGVWFGSHAVYYTLVSPSYSHATSMLAASLFFSAWLETRDRVTVARVAGWGALVGLMALMRWQDVVFGIIPLVEVLRWRAPWSQRLAASLAAATAFLVVFAPQMAVWTLLYGQPLALPQGPSFIQWTRPHPWAVLFSDNHGLFSWAPLLLLSAVGLLVALWRQPAWRLPMGAVVLSSWYINAAVADWWAGEAFGARRFLSLFPFFALGLATWLGQPESGPVAWRRRVSAVVMFGVLNWLLLLQYQVFMKGLRDLAAYPKGLDLWTERFLVPFRVVAWLFS